MARLRIGTRLPSSCQAFSHPTLGPRLQSSHFSTAACKPKHELHKHMQAHTCIHVLLIYSQAPASIRELHRTQVPHHLLSVSSWQRDVSYVTRNQETCVVRRMFHTSNPSSSLEDLLPLAQNSPVAFLPKQASPGRPFFLNPINGFGNRA